MYHWFYMVVQGSKKECLLQAVRHGIAKINIGTTTRQAYELFRKESVAEAQENVYNVTVELLTNVLEVAGSATILLSDAAEA